MLRARCLENAIVRVFDETGVPPKYRMMSQLVGCVQMVTKTLSRQQDDEFSTA